MPAIRRAVAARFVLATFALVTRIGQATARKKYDPGASDSEIKLGQTSGERFEVFGNLPSAQVK